MTLVGSALFASGCGGGGGDSTPAATSGAGPAPGAPPGFITAPLFGAPTSAFPVVLEKSTVQGLETFTITADVRSRPYEYLGLVYEIGGEYAYDYPVEVRPGVLQVTAPVGLLRRSGTTALGAPNWAVEYGGFRVWVGRFQGETALDFSAPQQIVLQPPATTGVPASVSTRVLLAAVMGATGRLRDQAVDATNAAAGLPMTGVPVFETLRATNRQLYSASVANAFAPVLADAREEQLLRVYLTAMLRAAGINLSDYIVSPMPRQVSDGSIEFGPLGKNSQTKAVTDIIDGVSLDLAQMGRDLAARARGNGGRLATVGSVLATAGALGVLGATVAPVAIGVGASMIAVGVGTGLVEGFLLDNVGAFGGMSRDSKLSVRPTIDFYFDTVIDYAVPEVLDRYVSRWNTLDTSGGAFSRIGAFVTEVSRSQMLATAGQTLRSGFGQAVDTISSTDVAAALPRAATAATRAVSQAWQSWSATQFSSASFPISSYRQSWAQSYPPPPPSAPPAPAPSTTTRPPGPQPGSTCRNPPPPLPTICAQGP